MTGTGEIISPDTRSPSSGGATIRFVQPHKQPPRDVARERLQGPRPGL